jgi:hypothetical protein
VHDCGLLWHPLIYIYIKKIVKKIVSMCECGLLWPKECMYVL